MYGASLAYWFLAEGLGSNDGHQSFYDWDWLRLRHVPSHLQAIKGDYPNRVAWGKEIAHDLPMVSYNEVMDSDNGWKYGFAYVDGCPATTSATKSLLERISFIRPTHYGGFWDFTSDLASKDTAYTNLALKAHTDTTYFTDPVRLQMFHLLSHTEGEGGVSLLVDGLRASNQLRRDFPDAFHILAKHRVPCHSNGNTGVSIRPSHAIPVLNRFFTSGTKVKQVRWNNSDRATLSTVASGAWYDAARKWVNILERPESEYWEQLKPGRALIFDNWRVLHGRSAFTGKRRMCGGYINGDDYESRVRTLFCTPEEIDLYT